MINVCPTITAENKDKFFEQLGILKNFSKRIHIDLSDGTLAPRKLVDVNEIHWPKELMVDIHVMSDYPKEIALVAGKLKPNCVILHEHTYDEAEEVLVTLRQLDVKVGLAIYSENQLAEIRNYIQYLDHVLLFSGNLGYQGGSVANLNLLTIVNQIKSLNPMIEIGWDGGVNETNIKKMVTEGIEVINVGGYIMLSSNPQDAYAKLNKEIE